MTAPAKTRPGLVSDRASRVSPRISQDTALVSGMRLGAREVLGRYADMGQERAVEQAREDLVIRAMKEGMTLTNLLEQIDPSSEYGPSDALYGLDAFERQLALANIRVKSDPAKGIYADPVNRFYQSDQPSSPVLFPEFINRAMRVPLIAAPILDELVAVTTPVDSDTYRAIYLKDTKTDRQMRRTPEGTEFPTVKLTTGENPINLHKYGLKLQGSYEVFRRMRIDLFSLHLARIALQNQLDKADTALDVIINGDGNSNSAVNYNLTALDSGTTAGNLTYKAWLRFGLKLFPYQLTTVVGGEAELLSVLTLQFPNINPLTLLSMLTGGQPVDMRVELAQNLWATVRLVYLSTAPSNVLVGLNRSTALEMLTEIGANITETDKIIGKQLNEIVVSEVVGFDILFKESIATLTLNA
jgi:hypothetical protein